MPDHASYYLNTQRRQRLPYSLVALVFEMLRSRTLRESLPDHLCKTSLFLISFRLPLTHQIIKRIIIDLMPRGPNNDLYDLHRHAVNPVNTLHNAHEVSGPHVILTARVLLNFATHCNLIIKINHCNSPQRHNQQSPQLQPCSSRYS
jgi:hypothetical protein